MKLAVIIPTYNEKENITNLIESLTNIFNNNKINGNIVVVDDNSPDGTGNIVDEIKKKNPAVNIVHREKRLGLGTAYITGMKFSMKNLNADLIMTMDSDFSHNPKYIPDFIRKINQGFDVVLGSRYVKGGGTYKWKIHRRIISKGANTLAKFVIGLKTNDNTTGFRCYKRKVLETIELDKIKSNGYSFLVEIAYLCQKFNFKLSETPILFVDRKYGETKISKKEIFKTLHTLLRLKLKNIF